MELCPKGKLFCLTQIPFVASGKDSKLEQTEKIGQFECNPVLSVSSKIHFSPNFTKGRHVLSLGVSPPGFIE